MKFAGIAALIDPYNKHAHIYTDTVGREFLVPFWPFFVPKETLPAAERSVFLEGGILDNMALEKKAFSGPDSPVPGSRFPPYPSVPKTPFVTLTLLLRNLYVSSGLVRIRPIFDKAPRNAENASPRESYYQRSVWKGRDFCTFFFLFWPIFCWLALDASSYGGS